jgi:hypothetical protein
VTHDWVYLLPITSTPPNNDALGVEIPPDTRRRLGLQDERCWVKCDEGNRIAWPSGRVRDLPTPHAGREAWSYGLLAADTFREIRDLVGRHVRSGLFVTTTRT